MDEKRKRQKPIPEKLEHYLTESQLHTVQFLKDSGWKLWFVRRSDSQSAMPVIFEDKSGKTAIIDQGGLINIDHGLDFRGPTPIPHTGIALDRFMKEAGKGENLWVTDNNTGDLVLAAHMLDSAARIPKELVDLANSHLNSIDLDWLKSRVEKDFGYHS